MDRLGVVNVGAVGYSEGESGRGRSCWLGLIVVVGGGLGQEGFKLRVTSGEKMKRGVVVVLSAESAETL